MKEIGVEYKSKEGDTPRTLIDRYAEEKILEVIGMSEFKNDYIYAEESGEKGSGKRIWYIDPFDGTSNATIKLPMSTMGIGIEENGDLVGAVVYNPFERKLFFAEKGEGAYVQYKNRRPKKIKTDLISNSAKQRFAWVDALFNQNTTPRKLKWISQMQEKGLIQNIRMTGSNIDYSAKIAESRGNYQLTDAVGGYFDLCGGLLIEEAGGKMANLKGNFPKFGDEVAIAVANPKDLEKVLKITTDCYKSYKGFR